MRNAENMTIRHSVISFPHSLARPAFQGEFERQEFLLQAVRFRGTN